MAIRLSDVEAVQLIDIINCATEGREAIPNMAAGVFYVMSGSPLLYANSKPSSADYLGCALWAKRGAKRMADIGVNVDRHQQALRHWPVLGKMENYETILQRLCRLSGKSDVQSSALIERLLINAGYDLYLKDGRATIDRAARAEKEA